MARGTYPSGCRMPRRKYDRMIPHEQAVTVGANIRALRRACGWTQTHLASKMGWASPSAVCAAEGHRDRTQRNFTPDEIARLAGIFGVHPWELTCWPYKGSKA
jgi:transcriptional regulator with XRE-family HTH domain